MPSILPMSFSASSLPQEGRTLHATTCTCTFSFRLKCTVSRRPYSWALSFGSCLLQKSGACACPAETSYQEVPVKCLYAIWWQRTIVFQSNLQKATLLQYPTTESPGCNCSVQDCNPQEFYTWAFKVLRTHCVIATATHHSCDKLKHEAQEIDTSTNW